MARVTMYTTSVCPFCMQAKRLLREHGIPYDEINVEDDPNLRTEMVTRAAGRRTVPQIFIDDTYVGGYNELQALADRGGFAQLS
ncbi:MAG: glutaredoxin 3 [Deltaproteobacteria bacterium]|nr:glutaredoxin 3 [Deltaproteobacteria bacterium]